MTKVPKSDTEKSLQAENAALRAKIAELEARGSFEEDLRRQLKESEEIRRNIVENSLEGIYVNQDHRIVFCNQRMAEMFGYASPEHIIGQDVMELVSPRSRELVEQELSLRLSGEKPVTHYMFCARRKDGSDFEVENLGCRIIFHGKPAVQGVLRDISRQNQLERQLRQAQKMEAIGALAGGIAHDFNNILSVIIGYSELILDSDFNRAKTAHNLEQVLKASYRARDLVQQILTFSRQRESIIERVEVNPLVKEVLKLLRATLPVTIRIESDISKIAYSIMAESTQIHQVLMNLCTNAAHAMRPQGGILRVELSDLNRDLMGTDANNTAPAAYLRLSVSDSGHGIPHEIQERIFDPFFTTKPVGEGTGLGLSVVHGIVKSLNGEISVESEPGKGTTFHLFLPILQEESSPTPSSQARPAPKGNGQRILLVDDEPELAAIARSMLEQMEYSVTCRTDGLSALDFFKKNPESVDILITDNMMAGMTGVELALEISKIRPALPIILCTGFGKGINRDNIRDLGIRALILKPYNKEELAKAIRESLATPTTSE